MLHQLHVRFRVLASVAIILASFSATIATADDAHTLFDGKTLDGWETLPEDEKWWSVHEGVITGGSIDLSQNIPHNTFLSTKDSYDDFELKVSVRLQGTEGFVNSGIQIRSVRVEGSPEMSGYQVDVGDGWWGKLYDESRRNKVISESKELDKVSAAVKKNEWNEIRIVAKGKRIQSWVNGVPAIDYTEEDDSISQEGKIGLQVHGDGKTLVQFKDITIQKL